MPANSNAIGSAAVILTANADPLARGFDKAVQTTQAGAARIGKALDKAAAGGKVGAAEGGILGQAFGGFKAGAAFAVAQKVVQKVGQIPAMVRDLGEKTGGKDGGALAGLSVAFTRLERVWDRIAAKAFGALAPAFIRVADAAEEIFARLDGPTLDNLFDAFGKTAYLGAEAFALVGGAVADLVKWFDEAGNGVWLLGGGAVAAGKLMFDSFGQVARAIDGMWDALKAGAGIMGVVGGTIVEGFAVVVEAIAKAVREVTALADKLPGALKPAWVDGLAAGVEGAAGRVRGLAAEVRQLGIDAVKNFGQGAVVAQWADQVVGKWEKLKKGFAEGPMPGGQLAGAMKAGSVEAYSVVAKYQSGQAAADAILKRQADDIKAVVRLQGQMLGELLKLNGNGAVVQVK